MYFLVVGLLDRLIFLSTGLSAILVFIGVKLSLHWAHSIWPSVPEITTATSLLVILGVLTATTVASVIAVRRDPRRIAHTGSLREHDEPEQT